MIISRRAQPFQRRSRTYIMIAIQILAIAALFVSGWSVRPATAAKPVDGLVVFTLSVSQHTLAPNETATFTIYLHNSGTEAIEANITAPVSQFLKVEDPGEGVLDATTNIIDWTAVGVEPGEDVLLEFMVSIAQEIKSAVKLENQARATFNYQENPVTVVSATRLVLVPAARGDTQHPVLESVTIGDADILYEKDHPERKVTLHIKATDNVAVEWMFIREWYLETGNGPAYWNIAKKDSGWVPFAESYEWELGDASGVHYVGVWVADGSCNRSVHGRNAIDFASLVKTDDSLDEGGKRAYMAYYDSGVEVKAELTSQEGDADLYVWYAGNFKSPNKYSAEVLGEDSVTFTTDQAGIYLFLVFAKEKVTGFNLTIDPPGGPLAPAMKIGHQKKAGPKAEVATFAPTNVLSESGVDPLGTPESLAIPNPPLTIYLPFTTNNR